MAHICFGKLTIIGSDNGLSPGWHQAIIWTNARILLTEPLGRNFSEIVIEIHTFAFKKMHLKMSSGKWRPFCLCFNVISKLEALGKGGKQTQYTLITMTAHEHSGVSKLPAFQLFPQQLAYDEQRRKSQSSALLPPLWGNSTYNHDIVTLYSKFHGCARNLITRYLSITD